MQLPFVSVIVPNFNHAKYLPQRIDTILQQTYQNFELIILDDNSTDQSQKILEKYFKHPKVSKVLLNSRNSGSPFAQWKKGIENASGEIIWIAESDDFAETTFLEENIKPFLDSPDVQLSYCYSPAVDEDGNLLRSVDYWPSILDPNRWNSAFRTSGTSEIVNYLRFANTIPNASAVIFRKSTAMLCNLDGSMKFYGDWWFWFQLLQKGSLAYTPQPLSFFRFHPNTTRNPLNIESTRKRLVEGLKLLERMNVKFTSKNVNKPKNHDWLLHYWSNVDHNNPKWVLRQHELKFATRFSVYYEMCRQRNLKRWLLNAMLP
jgi:glycosyltransferase involved in cell wall biosynthesis